MNRQNPHTCRRYSVRIPWPIFAAKTLLHFSRLNLCLLAALAACSAAAADFTLVPEQSSITLSGTTIGGIALEEQGAGSLSTRYEGVIRAEVSDAIRFMSGSVISARTNGSWQPITGGATGSEPANYGLKANAGLLGQAQAAARRVQFEVTSEAIPLNGTSFDSTTLVFSFLTNAHGTLDYVMSGFFPQKGSEQLAGYATNAVTSTASLTTSGDVQTLTIPIQADFLVTLLNENDTRLRVSGQLVATRSLTTQVPSYNTWASTHFPANSDPAVSGESADPDGDGLENFVEFALGHDPKAANNETQVIASTPPDAPGQVQFEYARTKGVSDSSVDFTLRQYPEMSPVAASQQITDLGNGKERVTLRLPNNEAGTRLYVLTISPM
jgi:hypothetical protein